MGTLSEAALRDELALLRARLDEAEQTLQAIRSGDVDALIVGDAVYTLDSAHAASNRLRSDVLAQMTDAVIAVDRDDHIIYLNGAAERQYGVAASAVLGHSLHRLYDVRWYRDEDRTDAGAAFCEGRPWHGENLHVCAGGRQLHAESTVTALCDSEGATTGRLVVSRDVSERYRAAADLRQAMLELARRQLEFSTLVENAPFVFVRFDRELRHAYVSPLIETYTGRPASAFIGRRHTETGVPAELAREWEELLRAVFATGEVVTTRFSFLTPQGELRHFEARLIPESSDRGTIESVLSIAIDITEREAADVDRRAAEQALRDADHRKDIFLATLAHELRNPLAPIGNALQIMRMSSEPAAHDAARGMIERQLRQLVHLVDDLLDVSRISQGKVELRKERIPLATVIGNAVETSRPLIAASRHELVLDLAASPEIVIDGDMTRLTQVVANLLNNAAKYTPASGRITVSTRREGEGAVIRVSDTGIGIPADRLPEIFDMFTQVEGSSGRSQGGLGIGLALVRRLVEMHGGSVDVTSAGAGRGSCFEVRLPADALPFATDDAALGHGDAPRGNGSRILVADDNRDSADSMALMLHLLGFETAVAYDGDQALQVARALRPRAAILDLGMPRLGGEEVARRLRAEDWASDMLLIALSGWGRDDDRRRTAAAGFDHHLVKPLTLEALSALLAVPAGTTAATVTL